MAKQKKQTLSLKFIKTYTDVQELLRADHRFDKSITITLNIEPNAMVFANATNTLTQVLLNLFLNAMDAVQKTCNPFIGCQLFTDTTTKIIIDIEDNGTGIESENIQHLFDPFFTTKDTGTGLGLSIVHQIISDHQGSVCILKTNKSGTTFRITLPKLFDQKK